MRDLNQRLGDAQAQLQELATQNAFSGAVHVDQSGEMVLSVAHGIASRRWNTPVTQSMRFDVASVTKLFTAVAVLQQVEAGTLDLDGSIHTYVDLAGTAISPKVTIRQLLTHTSGIADDADEEAGESYEALWRERPNYSVTQTADFLPQFAFKPATFGPGEGCRYCNCGYVLLGLALEGVTGKAYRAVIRQDVFAAAGMTRSGFFSMDAAVPDVAEGWEPTRSEAGEITGWRQNIYSYPPIGSPDGGAHVTASDLVAFYQAVRGGVLLGSQLTAQYLSPQVVHHRVEDSLPGGPAAVHYAFGLEIETRADGTVRSLYKDGINVGASAMVRHYPDVDVTVAVVANSESGAWGPVRLLDAAITLG